MHGIYPQQQMLGVPIMELLYSMLLALSHLCTSNPMGDLSSLGDRKYVIQEANKANIQQYETKHYEKKEKKKESDTDDSSDDEDKKQNEKPRIFLISFSLCS
jgi:hypothetical protein